MSVVLDRFLARSAQAAGGDAHPGICTHREAARHALDAGVDRIGDTELTAAIEVAR